MSYCRSRHKEEIQNDKATTELEGQLEQIRNQLRNEVIKLQ